LCESGYCAITMHMVSDFETGVYAVYTVGAAHILGKMEHTKVSQGLWQLCAIQVEQLSKVMIHLVTIFIIYY